MMLADQRKKLGLSFGQLAKRARCNRTTIFRLEEGLTKKVPMNKAKEIALAYEIDVAEFLNLCGYGDYSIPERVIDPTMPRARKSDSEITANYDDLEFLATVARGLNKPMSITLIRDLLICRSLDSDL